MKTKKGETCPLCDGGKVIWGTCCSGRECGCYGLPVTTDCYQCKHTGVLQGDIEEDEVSALQEDIKWQEDTQKWMEETYPDYFKQQ